MKTTTPSSFHFARHRNRHSILNIFRLCSLSKLDMNAVRVPVIIFTVSILSISSFQTDHENTSEFKTTPWPSGTVPYILNDNFSKTLNPMTKTSSDKPS